MKITKITASKKDDILKRKAQYELDKAAYDTRQNESRRALHEAERAATEPLRKFLESHLSQFDALTFNINISRGYNWGRGDEEYEYADVRIQCNEHNKFDSDVALSWSYDVKLGSKGEVIRESSSWSGLKATTPAQLESLRQTVEALEFLNEVNWNTLVRVDMPSYDDYRMNEPAPVREDWDKQLGEAEIEEIIGQGKLIKVNRWDTCPINGKYVYLQIMRETPAQYIAKVVDSWSVDKALQGDESGKNSVERYLHHDTDWNVVRVRKSNVRPVTPIVVLDISELIGKDLY